MKTGKYWGMSFGVTLLAIALIFSTSFAQTPPVTTNIVNIDDSGFPTLKAYLSVSDQQGFPITSLDPALVRVTEDGNLISGKTVTALRNEEQPLAIVIAIDTSGSVRGQPLQNAVAAAKVFINTLQAEDKVGVVSFNETAEVMSNLSNDHAAVITILENLVAQGNTALYNGLIESINLLENRPERKVILLLTDGYETGQSTFKFDDVVNAANSWSTPIYPIGYGAVDRNTLERMGPLTGGFTQIRPDSNTLNEALTNVVNYLREQYLVEYTSTLPADNTEHELSITVDYEGTALTTSQKFMAVPGQVVISLPDLPLNSPISGIISLKPEIISPGPISQLDLYVDDVLVNSINTPPFEFTLLTDQFLPGVHNFIFVAVDTAGNSAEYSHPLEVITSLIPNIAEGELIGGNIVLSTQTQIPAGVQKVEYYLDNQIKIGESTTSPYEVAWNTRQHSPGEHQLKVVATDPAGNVYEKTINLVIDQSPGAILWIALIALLAATAIILPLALRKNKKKRAPDNIDSAGAFQTEPPVAIAGSNLTEILGITPGQVWPLTIDQIRLGRKSDENDIPLMGLSASRSQGIIQRIDNAYYLHSLKSENPMILNGNPVITPALLQPGDIIEAGESQFRFESN